jgi:2-polyprenyl-3-methyl-5-hydroxy-6-metoxy-1,4-benzoquinol methylase
VRYGHGSLAFAMKSHAIDKLGQPILAVMLFAGTATCAKAGANPAAMPPHPSTQAAAQSAPEPVVDAGQPAIACPLAKQGVHPADLRPFKDVEKYIAFLERPERATWQRPDAVVAALGLAGNETVVDVGAGSGYFSFRLARALPGGSVVASDIQPEMVRHMHHRALREGVQNLRVVLGQAEEPGIPPAADLVFVCDVLHHVPNQPAWLGKLAREMKVGARLVLVEFKEGKLPQGPPEKLKLSRSKLIELAKNAGLVLAVEKPNLLPYQTFLIFRKP